MMGEEKPIGRNAKRNCKKHELTNNERSAVLQALLERSTDRVLKRGAIKQVADELNVAAERLGLQIELVCQPPNSPDLNVLDLGYFNAIQSIQHQQAPNNVDQLIEAVEESFNKLQKSKLNNTFLSLQLAMEQVILVDGDNNYKLRHMSKEKLEREGKLEVSITISDELQQKLLLLK